mgnify:CR=1 FL=1
MNEPLSEPAKEVLEQLTAAMTPSASRRAQTWSQLQRRIAATEHDDRWTFGRRAKRGFRYVRGYLRRMWMPLLLVLAIALAAGQFLRGDSGETYLSMARSEIEAGNYRAGYNLLAEHSRRYHTKSAAEARMGLVIDALCGLKMYDKADEDLRRYLDLNPDSDHASRLDDLCPGVDVTATEE